MKKNTPLVSIIVVFYDMSREAPRTLHTLTPEYQGVSASHYEVIVIDNGSPTPLDAEFVCSMSCNFKYVYIEDAHPSPASALNKGAALAEGKILGLSIDGARMLSPGVLGYAIRAFKTFRNPIVTTLGFHLGPKIQIESILDGYNQTQEDSLLENVPWATNGYRLFEISSFAGSSRYGWFAPAAESNCLFLSSRLYDDLGGFDEAFDFPGGGLVNVDFYSRACRAPNTELVQLLGEGTFHQFHGGAMTGKTAEDASIEYLRLDTQYKKIRGHNFQMPLRRSHFIGHFPKSGFSCFEKSMAGIEKFRADCPEVATNFERDEPPLNISSPDLSRQRKVIILGMHRSGTSMLAGSLREAGLFLGSINTKAPHNLKGNMEHPTIMHMQEDLLVHNNGTWDDPPADIIWSQLHLSVRDLFISTFKDEQIWGFKDPRTIFTLDGWMDALPDAELIGIFRHPYSVAMSLQKRNNFTLDQGFELWRRYNKKLVNIYEKSPFPLIEFHQDTNILKTKLNSHVRSLLLPDQHMELNFFEEHLRSSNVVNVELPAEIERLYNLLTDRCI